MYGGAAGGAKSWTGCADLAFKCLAYPRTRWFIGRNELKRITESTLITFFKVCSTYGIENGYHFSFNAQKNFIKFSNGSRIDLLDLKYMPSDPVYERFGSTEYTGGWIEEAPEVNFLAFEVLKTRIGRHLNDKYNLIAKILLTANPNKNWCKREFYDKEIKGLLGGVRKFLQSLVTENPFIESGYIERLKRLSDQATKERLLNGNWEYDDDPNALCPFDAIEAVFENDHVLTGTKYITADIARLGSDKAVIFVWSGWNVIDYKVFDVSLVTDIQQSINAFRVKYQVPTRHAIADQDGVGGGVVDNCGILGFTNNARPFEEDTGEEFEKPEYQNLKTQCGYYLAAQINASQINFSCEVEQSIKELILQELGQLKSYQTDKDGKVRLLPKEKIKENIGRSPDFLDTMLMRSYFDLDNQGEREIFW